MIILYLWKMYTSAINFSLAVKADRSKHLEWCSFPVSSVILQNSFLMALCQWNISFIGCMLTKLAQLDSEKACFLFLFLEENSFPVCFSLLACSWSQWNLDLRTPLELWHWVELFPSIQLKTTLIKLEQVSVFIV